ncbi:MAG TPA: CBS domain-containing protein [Bryobacteraceae bacterium]|nr:CBS domain-containing protein [Bryobacteraceae bacterium]
MTMSDPVTSVLKGKRGIWSVSPETSVFEAMKVMAEKDIGALLVMNGRELVGIMSERDYARKVVLHGRSSRETLVRDIMSSPPITVSQKASIDECMSSMTSHRIRHLPVVDGAEVVGVVSIGDLVNWIISSHEKTIDHLQQYIAGAYPA